MAVLPQRSSELFAGKRRDYTESLLEKGARLCKHAASLMLPAALGHLIVPRT